MLHYIVKLRTERIEFKKILNREGLVALLGASRNMELTRIPNQMTASIFSN